ncbi:MAG: lysozyme inhibitor LprI family protein [Pseudoxanthomonas sp.]
MRYSWMFMPLCALATPAAAASFDCDKAAGETELLICSNPSLSSADERLQEDYANARDVTPNAQRGALRDSQRQWMAKRDACSDVDCLAKSMQARQRELEALAKTAEAAFDRIVATIPADPAVAAHALADYRSPLADAWRVYLGRFEPASGVSAATTEAARARATVALEQADNYAASVLHDAVADTKTLPGTSELMLLRMWIERADYDFSGSRPYVHCFVFARQGWAAFNAMGSLYGSSRDDDAPLCEPRGDLFEQPGWKALEQAFHSLLSSIDASRMGTIRFASYAQWRSDELMATVAPALFLSDPNAWEQDPRACIEAWANNPHWPSADREAALAALEPTRRETVAWLMRHHNLPEAKARTIADRIVQAWVDSRDNYVREWLPDDAG